MEECASLNSVVWLDSQKNPSKCGAHTRAAVQVSHGLRPRAQEDWAGTCLTHGAQEIFRNLLGEKRPSIETRHCSLEQGPCSLLKLRSAAKLREKVRTTLPNSTLEDIHQRRPTMTEELEAASVTRIFCCSFSPFASAFILAALILAMNAEVLPVLVMAFKALIFAAAGTSASPAHPRTSIATRPSSAPRIA